jgi:salicylate hydroxylase
MLPFFGQGAAQAIEDAAALAKCFAGVGPDGVADALQRYEFLRKPRASQVQLMSRGREIRNHLPDGPEQQARDTALGAGEPLRQSAWIYAHEA